MNGNSLTTDSGSINIDTDSFTQTGVITSTSGSIDINTTSFDQQSDVTTTGGVIVSSTSGDITMTNEVTTSGSSIEYIASDNVNLSTLSSTGIVNVIANSGYITEQLSGNNPNVIGTTVTLTAATGIGDLNDIEMNVDTLIATNSVSGDINVEQSDGGDLTIESLETQGGDGNIDVRVLSGIGDLLVNGAVTADGSGDVTLTAVSGEVDINADISSASGDVTISGYSVDQHVNIDIAGNVKVTADNGSIDMDESTSTSGSSIEYTATLGSINLEQLEAIGGDINVTANTGALTIDDSITASTTGNITLTAQNGAVVLSDNSGAGSYISSVDGNVNITGDSVTQNDDISTNGSVTVTADTTDITMANGKATSGLLSIVYKAATNVMLSILNSDGTVEVTADSGGNGTGSITDNLSSEDANIIGTLVTLSAATGIGDADDNDIDTTIDTLTATNTVSGDIYIEEADDLALDQVMNTTDGGTTGFGMVSLTAGATTDGAITDGNGGTVNIVSDTAILTADTGIGTSADAVDTQITTLTATNTVSGDIYIEEADDLALDQVMNTTDGGTTGFGTVSLTAGATTDGAITDGNGGTVNIVSDTAILSADTGIGTSADAVETQITTLTATNTVSGDIYIEEADDLALDQVMNTTDGGTTGFGTVSLTAGATTDGAITDGNGGTVNIVSDTAILTADTGIGTNADAVDTQITTLTATNTVSGDIYIEEADDLALDQVMNTTDGGTTGFGTVSLTAGATTDGAITDGNGGTVNIVSDTAILTADTGIGTNADAVDTQITTLTATNTVSGDIYIEEADDLALDQVMNTTDGGTTGFGTVSLTAGATTDGAITDGNGGTVNIVSDTAILTADTGIGTNADAVDTQITTLTATNTVSGDIYIEEADDLALDQVMNTTDGGTTGFGTVSLTAGATTDGAITDGNGGTVNIVSDTAILTADTGIGTSADAVDTQITTLTATNTATRRYLYRRSGRLGIGSSNEYNRWW